MGRHVPVALASLGMIVVDSVARLRSFLNHFHTIYPHSLNWSGSTPSPHHTNPATLVLTLPPPCRCRQDHFTCCVKYASSDASTAATVYLNTLIHSFAAMSSTCNTNSSRSGIFTYYYCVVLLMLMVMESRNLIKVTSVGRQNKTLRSFT